MVVDRGDLSFGGIVLGGGLNKNVQCKVAKNQKINSNPECEGYH